jgi:hypothetical protein
LIDRESLPREYRAICERLDRIVDLLYPAGALPTKSAFAEKPQDASPPEEKLAKEPPIQGATSSISDQMKKLKGD